MNLIELPCDRILADPENNVSRSDLDPAQCQDIALSIQEQGLIMPVAVRPIGEDREVGSQFSHELVMGFRRFTAVSVNLGLPKIKAFVRECTPEEARILNLTENLQRKNLSFWEQARGLKLAFPADTPRPVIQKALGYSDDWVKVRWKVWTLPNSVIEQIEAGLLSAAEVSIILQQERSKMLSIAKKLRTGKKAGKTIKDLERGMTNRKAHRSKTECKKMMTAAMERDKMDAVHALRYACGEISDTSLLDLLDNPQ